MPDTDLRISAQVSQFFSGLNMRELATLPQTGLGSASGWPVSDTSWATFDLTDVTIAGMGWILNLGTNDISLSLLITTVTEGAVNYPFGIAKPGMLIPFYWDPTIKTINPLQHKTASGTSSFRWQIFQV